MSTLKKMSANEMKETLRQLKERGDPEKLKMKRIEDIKLQEKINQHQPVNKNREKSHAPGA